MLTLRWIPSRFVVRRPVRTFLVTFAALVAVFTPLAVTGNITSAAAADDGVADVTLGGLLSPVSEVFADGVGVAAATTSVMIAAATPPPPPPVACPVPESEFIDSWGFARSGGRRHKGVDMMAPHGKPVLAPVAGTLRSSNSALGGLGFYLDDADGNTYFGSHLASLDATGWVEAGTQIGTVGSTGNASTPHLHFEVMLAGSNSVNPYPFAAAWCGLTDADPLAG